MSNALWATAIRPDAELSHSAQLLGSATVAEIREQIAGLAGNSDLALLRRVARWMRATGWTNNPYVAFRVSADGRTAVDYEPNTQQIRVLRRSSESESWPWSPIWYPVVSVREAVDLLVLLGVLPAAFSSMYAAGRADRAVEVAA